MDYQRTPSNLLPPTPTPWRCSRGWRSLFLTTAWLWLALGSCGSVFAVANSSTSSSSGGGGEIDLPFFCGRRGGSGDASDNGPPTTFVHLVLHSHVDAGWTNTVKVYESMASHIVRGVLAALPSTATESSAASSTPLHQDALQRDALPAQFKARRTFTWGDVFGLVKFLEQSGDQIPTTAGLSANEPGVVGGGGGGGGGVAHNTSWRDVAVQALRAGHLALVSGGWVQEDEAATTLRESLLQMNLGQEELLLALSAQSGVVPNREENKRIAGQSEMGGGEPTAELGQSTKAPQPGEYLGLEEQWDSRNESAVNTFFPEMQARLDRLSRVQSLRPHGTRLPPSSAPRAGEALLPVRTAWQIDSFGHSSLTARVLEELGYHSAVLNRIDQHEKDRRAATASLDFWWGGERASLTRDSLASSSTGNKEPHPALLAHILPKHYATPSELHDIHASTSLPLPRMGSNTLTKWANSLASLARKQAQGPFRHSGGHVLVLFGDDVVLQEPLAARRLFDRLDLVLATIANSTGSETGSTDFSDICAGYSTPQWYFQSVRQHEAQHRGLQDRADGTSTRRRKASVGRRHNTSHSIAQVGRYSGSREIALEDFPSMGSFIASVPAGGGKGGSSHQLFNNESTTPRPLFGNQTRGRLSTSSSKALRSQSRSRRLEDASRSFTKYTGSFMPYLQNSMNAWTGFLATRPRLKQQRRLAQSDFDAAATLTAVATMNAMANAKARAGTAPQPVAPLCDRAALRPAVRVLATLSHHDAVTGTCTAAVAEDYLRLVQGARRVLQACAVSAVNNISATSSATLASDQWRGVLPQEPLYGPPAWVAQQEAAWEQRRKVSESTISGDDQRKTRALVLSAPLRSPQHGSRSKPQLAADLQRLSSKSKLRPVPNAFFSVFSLFNPTIMTRTEIFCFNLEFDDDAIAAYAPDCVTDAAPFAANASAKDTNTGAPRELPRVDFEDPTPMQGCLVPTSVSIVELPSEVPVESQLLADSSSRRTADHVDREVCMKVNRSVGLSFRSFKITVTAAAMTPHARLHDAPKQRAADRTAQNAKSMQTPWAWEVPAALVPPPDLSYVLRHSALEYLSGHSTWTGSGLYTFRTLQWPTMRILFVFSVGGLAGVAGALVLESVGALVRPFGCPIASGASPRVQVPPTYGWLLHTALSCFGMPSARFLSLELFSALAAIVLGKYCLVRTELLVAGWAMLSAFCAASAVRLACAATSPKANQRYALLPGLTGITDNVTENYCDSDDDGAGSAADDDGIFTEDEGRLHLPSAEAKVRARVAFVRSTTLASLAGGVVGGYMLVATLEAPQLLSRMLLHKLFAGWSFFPGDFCSGPVSRFYGSVLEARNVGDSDRVATHANFSAFCDLCTNVALRISGCCIGYVWRSLLAAARLDFVANCEGNGQGTPSERVATISCAAILCVLLAMGWVHGVCGVHTSSFSRWLRGRYFVEASLPPGAAGDSDVIHSFDFSRTVLNLGSRYLGVLH